MAGSDRDPQSELFVLRAGLTTSETTPVTDWKFANKPTHAFATGGIPTWGFRFFATSAENATFTARLSGWREGGVGRELMTVEVRFGARATLELTGAYAATTMYEADTLTISRDMIDYQTEAVADAHGLILVDTRALSWLAWENTAPGNASGVYIVGAPGGA
ncbi:MAG TPA: hypothetical protein VMZ31_05325 [Phycisphaerae bacterium]|nr:hypothetical protein [Phycisphaerae bacterium]